MLSRGKATTFHRNIYSPCVKYAGMHNTARTAPPFHEHEKNDMDGQMASKPQLVLVLIESNSWKN